MMRTTDLLVGLSALMMVGLTGGCASREVAIDNPIPIARTEYDRVFEASLRVLRDYHFVIARQDRRYGLITTRPHAAASALEPWFTDNTTSYQTLDNTLNYDRRIVTVYLEKRPDADDDEDAELSPADRQFAEAGGVQTDYQLRVDVEVERRQIPPTPLHTAAMTSVASYGYQGNIRTVLTEQGYEKATWRQMGHDTYFEQRLTAQILAVAGRIQPLHNTVEPGAAPTPDASPVERVQPGEIPAPPSDSTPSPQPPVPNP